MAGCSTRLLNLLTLLSIFLAILLLSHMATSSSTSSPPSLSSDMGSGRRNYHNDAVNANDDGDDDDDDEYILDSPLIQTNNTGLRRSSRFLASIVKKGTHCNPRKGEVCNGVWANRRTSFLLCCKKHCRNVLGDWNNCGRCGHRCRMNEKCCKGHCVDVMFNHYNCGKCNRKCFPFESCHMGICGYD